MNSLSTIQLSQIEGGNFWDTLDWICLGVDAAGIVLDVVSYLNAWNVVGWISGGAQIACGLYGTGRYIDRYANGE